MNKQEIEIWLIKNFKIDNSKAKTPQVLKKGTVYKYLVNQVYEKTHDDISIIGIDEKE